MFLLVQVNRYPPNLETSVLQTFFARKLTFK